MITFDEFKKVEITVGKILSAEKVPETDKLLKLSVDFGSPLVKGVPPSSEGRVVTTPVLADSGTPFIKGDNTTTPASGHPSSPEEGKKDAPVRDIRQIISGISMHFSDPQTLVGKKCMFVSNLQPRVIKGLESNGMILTVSTDLPAGVSAQAGDGKFSLLEPNADIPEGTKAK